MTIKTQNQLEVAANEWANTTVGINEIEASQATDLNDLKKRYKSKLDAPKKEAASLKRKIKNFVVKNAAKLFHGKDSGTVKTNQVEIKLRNNPPRMKQIDPGQSEEQLIERAKQHGYRHVIVEKESISKEALERLDDAELETLGFYREASKSFDIIPLAIPSAKSNSRLQEA